MSDEIPIRFLNVLAEWLFSALLSNLESLQADSLIELLILYSWASAPGVHPDPGLTLAALRALEKAGGWEDIKTMSIYTQAVPTRTIESYLPSTRLLANNEPVPDANKAKQEREPNIIFVD